LHLFGNPLMTDYSRQEVEKGPKMQPGTRNLTIMASFTAIYLIWGSTYLAIRIGIETLPPFLMAGIRFAVAGGLLYGWLRIRGVPRPTDRQWWGAAITGTLMLVGGVGGVTWAEQRVESGSAALLAATVPLWMTTLDRGGPLAHRRRVVFGLALGFAGVVALVGPAATNGSAIDPLGAMVILAGALCWSLGSLRSRKADLPGSPVMTVAVQMATAGAVLLVVSSVTREWQSSFSVADVSGRSAIALVYLVVIGSMLVMSAYVFLLREVSAPAVATYAFVNPIVAVFLGCAFAGESVGWRVVLATALIVAAVVVIQSIHWRRAPVAGSGAGHTMNRFALPGILPATRPAAVHPTACPCREENAGAACAP
jgi:drug/metabolite transporter (DMT)-like permease